MPVGGAEEWQAEPRPRGLAMSSDPVDVVVGAASGIGRAVASMLRGDRRLLIADRDRAAQTVARELGGDTQWLACDITDPAAISRLRAHVQTLGSLITTAGVSPTMASGERIFEVNLVGIARLLLAFEPALVPGSAAVCFASIAGHAVVPDAQVLAALDAPLDDDLPGRLRRARVDPDDPGTAYGLSKLGVMRLVQRTAAAWAKRGARILSLSPGIIDTPMGRQELAQQPLMQGMVDVVGRMGTAEEVAAVTTFLVSDGASFMNGCDVLVDGGLLAMAGATTDASPR
jgi:NAD(P)-dependent dehydrogenase (short-subunit alcohol dehydrogenase family)